MFWKKKRDPDALESLTTTLAQNLAGIQSVFYSGCLKGISDSCGNNKVQPGLTSDGHVVVGSFQMWLMFNVLDCKGEKYLALSASKEFTNQMYRKLIYPHMPEESTAQEVSKGVVRFDNICREDATKPYEEFFQRIQEIIFDGKCDIAGYWRSTRALGLELDGGQRLGIRAAINYMEAYLIHATQLAVAEAFGDTEFAKEQIKALEVLANEESEASE